MPEDGEAEKKDKDEEEESELFVGDCVRIAGSMAEVKKHLEVVDISWEGSYMGVLGKNGIVKSVRFHPGDDKARQICVVNVHEGPEVSLPGASLTVVEDDESDKESVDKGSDEEEEEEEEERVRVPLRVNMRVEDTKRKKKKKVCIGVILELGESETNVKYEDGRTKRVANTRLRPLERVTRDATGYSGDSSFNDFRFTKNCLPTGIEVVGDGADLEKNRAGQSYLHLKKNTYLRVPLRGLRHEKLRPGEPIPRYTLSLEVRLADSHRRLGDSPWSLFQASFPDPHSTDELCVVAEDKPHKRKWKVLTKENGLVVTAEADPNSKELCRLPANAVVVEDGIPPKRLPTGERRLRIRYKADAAKQAEGDLIDAMEPEEYVVEVEAGYFGSDFGTAATSIRVCSKGVLKTLNFRPGIEGGSAGVDGEQGASMGWTPRDRTMHVVRITIRKTGWHTFEIIDGTDSEKTWSKDFKVLGWFDDYKGISGISITDPDNEELELGKEREYHNSGTHKLRLRRMGEATADVDDKFDPRGWVTIRKTDMELVEEAHGQKAAKGPQCFLRAGLAERSVTSNRYLRSDRWHTVTITSDCQDRTVLVFLDGMQATEKEINIGSTAAGLGTDDAGRRVQGPVSPLEILTTTSGLLTGSPYAVPQAGFLLFASSSARGMPGGIMLRRITFYNTMLGSQQVEEQYLNSRYQREKKPPPQQLALSPAMKKSAPYLWIHGSFLCEFADCFIGSAGGDLVHLLRAFVLGMEGACKSISDGPAGGKPLWLPEQQNVLHDIVELFQRSEALFKKWQPLWAAEEHAVPSLAASYVRRLQSVRQNLRNQGGRLLIPLGIKTLDVGSQMVMLILEKRDAQNYRLTIINSGLPGLDWHACSSAEPPKFKSQAALAFDNIPSWKAEDDAFWAMLVITSAIPPSPMMAKEPLPLYDKFIPWLIGCPLEHYFVTNVYGFDGQVPEQEQCEAGQDLRTPQYGGTGAWRCMTFALRFLLRDAGLPVVTAKFMKWHLRRSFLKLAIKDLASARALSTSERTVLRIAAKQFALGAVKVSNRLAQDVPDMAVAAERLLGDARSVVSELEAAVNAKPGAHHVWNDPSVLPVLDLQSGVEDQDAEAWGLHPFFERILRTDVSPGAATGVPLLVPINLLQVPSVVNDLDEVHRTLQLCEILCAKLAFVGKERCKFSPYLRVSLLQHVFTELIPLPLGPATQKAPLNLRDQIWAPEGWDAVHPQMTRACQLELLLILRRLAEHFAAAACTLASNKGFDATKITVFGAIAAIADRVARTTARRSRDTGAEEGPSALTEALNGTLGGRPVAVDPNTFLVQSETIETAAPELNLARTAICAYFCEVMSHYEIKKLKDETLFDWDTYGWMMYVEREKGLERVVKQMCAKHLLETGKEWGKLVAGNQSENAYLVRTWPEFAALRDIMFFWKYFLCTDLRVFPDTNNWSLQAAYLAWNVANENEVFGPPTNRGAIFQVSAFGQDHVLKTNEPNYRPKPSASGHRYASAALASKYTGRAVVRTEDDLLYLRSLPTFEDRLRPSDAEALLSFLTVPYIRMPLMLSFFTSADRVNCLFSDTLRSILHAVVLEPGKFLMPGRWHDCPQMVPAASAAEAELLATPFGQLLTELSCSPKMPLSLSGRLLELALVLANSVTSDTVGVVLFAIRVAARVESATSLLLRAHSGGIKSSPLLAASLNMSENVLAELRAGKQYLRRLFSEAFQWIDTWLDELKDLIKTEAGAQEMGRPDAQRAREAETKQKRVDEHMRCACNLHAHAILMLRNVDLEEDGPSTVCKLLSSFAFLSMHHTFNLQDGLDIPEPELFEIYHRHRRHLIVWFENRMEKKEYKNFNSVLQTVHEQFSALDAASSIDTAEFEWGSIGGDVHNAGRYCVVGRKRSDADRGEITSVTEDKSGATWVELNVQLLQVTVRGRYVTPLEEETSGHSDFRDILRLRGREAKTVQCAALLSTDLVKVRELLSFPFRTLHWTERPSNALPVLTDADRIYDVEDLDASEGFIAELFEPVRRQFFAQPVVPQDILFFLQEEIPDGAAVAVLTGVHPRIRGRVWKEVLVFRELRVVHIYGILNYGGQCYRRLEYTTNCKYALSGLQPAFQNRPSPWPEWGRHQAGKPETEPKNFPASVVLSRTLVRRPPGKGTGPDGREPLDDEEQWSDGDVSEEEDDEGERTVWERAQREGEQYLPQRVLEGLLPEALLKSYRFYQTNAWPHRVIHGYKLNEQKEEEEESGTPQHFVEVRLVKSASVVPTRTRGWQATVALHCPGRPTYYLLNLLYASEGSPLHSLARTLTRFEDLSHILAWTCVDPQSSEGKKPSIDLVELPRLSVNFKSLRKDGELRLYCVDHGDLFLPNGPPTALRSEAARLLSPLPHALLLQTENSEFHILCPNVKVFRPVIDSDPFSTELVFARADFKWNKNARNKSFLYPVHPTLSFLQTPTQNSALYLLLMQWLHRNHGEAAALVNSISTDDRLDAGEAQIFEQLGIIGDADADTCAIRLQITLAMSNAPGLEWPWENCGQVQGYLKKLSHVSARCRLSLAEEIRVLRICSDERKRRDLVRAEVKAMKRQFWGYYGKVKLQRYHKMLTDAVAALEASAQDHRELQEWLKHIRKKVRAAQLPGGREEVKEVLTQVLGGWEKEDPMTSLVLENREKYIGALQDTTQRPFIAPCPERPKESKWQCHLDQNVLMCSLFDLLFEVLGAELLLREDVGEDSEGPEIPLMRRMSLPMAMEHAKKMINGECQISDTGTYALLYSVFTRSVAVKLGRSKEVNYQHQHSFGELLLQLTPGARNHGILNSVLHILALNPETSAGMPQLTKPKKVRLVKQWKAKLSQIQKSLLDAAYGLQLQWPPHPKDFGELPVPVHCEVANIYLELPPSSIGGLNPQRLFNLRGGRAALGRRPVNVGLGCNWRPLRTSKLHTVTAADLDAFASRPLKALVEKHVRFDDPAEEANANMPFNLDAHPAMQHAVAKAMMGRLAKEMRNYAAMHNKQKLPKLVHMDIDGIVEGNKELLEKALAQLRDLFAGLQALKEQDESFVSSTIDHLLRAVDACSTTEEIRDHAVEREHFWLLRYAGHETEMWFQLLCRTLLSPDCLTDFKRFNPFMTEEEIHELLAALSQMMLVTSRRQQVCRAMDHCRNLLNLLERDNASSSVLALKAGLTEKSSLLSNTIAAERIYISENEGERGFDPRFLLFEFISGFLLRPRQVEMVREFLDIIHSNNSAVKQMIMGQGKTTVVTPLLSFVLADAQRLVVIVVPHALLEFSRSVLQGTFASVVQKQVSTFKCDRAVDIDFNFSLTVDAVRQQADLIVTTPGDVKSLLLRFLEQLEVSSDRRSKKNTLQLRRETLEMGKVLQMLRNQSVCMLDEVDLILHPLKSELNFPTGPKSLIHHAPERWRLPLHVLDGFFAAEDAARTPAQLKESHAARQILQTLSEVVHRGTERKQLQKNPHLVLLSEDFFHNEMKPILCQWMCLWLTIEHVGRVFEEGFTPHDRGLSEEEITAYLMTRTSPVDVKMTGSKEDWQQWASETPWLQELLGTGGSAEGDFNPHLVSDTQRGIALHSEYKASIVDSTNGVVIRFRETPTGVQRRLERVDRLPTKDVQTLNLGGEWLATFLPHCLQKIDRVTFGIMTDDQVKAALAEQPLMPLTRSKLAIPFVGKDVPSQSSEFAHPDIVLGLTSFAYRYEGLRRSDFDEVMSALADRLENEGGGSQLERPTALRWKSWVEEAGAVFCVKQREMDERPTTTEDSGEDPRADKRPRVLPLHLLEKTNAPQMYRLFELFRRLPSAIHFYLETIIFPNFMRFQEQKFSASGQEMGGSILFKQRLGFSGTPSELMPRELGQCEYEPGSEGEVVSTLTSPSIVSFKTLGSDWTVEALLDAVAEAACRGECQALIDTGALVTGLTNKEVAEHLLGLKKRTDGTMPVTLPEWIEGVVFIEEDGAKRILNRQSREIGKLADSGVPISARFCFYDQIHTTGMDIQHRLDAVAALTLGKDMVWRDFAQGAYRMRGIGRGQSICLYIIPEIEELISRDMGLATLPQLPKFATLGSRHKGVLDAVACWLLCQSMRTEKVQYAMLQLQNLANIWRRSSLTMVMEDYEAMAGMKPETLARVQVYKEPIDFKVPSKVPHMDTIGAAAERRIADAQRFVQDADRPELEEIRGNMLRLAEAGGETHETEGERGLETEQQREQEQERQQEVEEENQREQEIQIEKFVDLMHCRDHEEPVPWDVDTLAVPEESNLPKQFYEARDFCLWKRQPLKSLPEECLLSRNWFDPQWSGFRRVKNVYMQLEWVSDKARLRRTTKELPLTRAEEHEMHRKMHLIWDLLNRKGATGDFEIAPKWRYRGGTNTEDAQGSPVSPSSQHVDFEPPEGEIAQMEILRLLQASFDWDTAFHSVTAAMAVLQSGGDVQAAAVAAAKAAGDETGQSSLGYVDACRLLRAAYFRPRDEGRGFIILSLSEAETLRRIMHCRVGKPLLAQHPETSVALRCVMSNHMMFDESLGFAAGPKFQTSTMQQVARFLDCQTFYREPELSVLLRALQHDQPFGRRRFLESLGSCRRRALANWQEQPIAAVLQKNWLEFDQTLSRLRAVRLRDAIEGQGLSVEAAFQKYDVDNSGLLEPMEFCRALHDLGFAFTAEEVANWVEAIDENGDYCVDNQEFLAFVKTQVNSLLTSGISGHSSLPESIGHAKKPRGTNVAPTVDISSQKKLLKRQTSDVVTAAEVEHEVHLRKAQQRKAEADEERLKAEEEEGIEVLIEEELGQNPESGEGWTEYNFQAARLPKETYALGIVELVPELYGSSGKSFCLLEPGAGLVVKELQLRGTAGGRLNCFSLTLWFRVPNLPLKADRLIFLDFPRQSNDPQQFDTPEEEQNTGKIFIWKNGIIAPEGCHEPRILSKKKRRNQASRGTPAALATGEWQLRFLIQAHGKVPAGPPRQVSAEVIPQTTGASQLDEVVGETMKAQGAAANAARALSGEPQGKVSYTVQITCDANSGALRVRPARGNRLASGGSGEEIFTVIARLTEERRRLIKDEMGGREGDTDFLSKRLWKKHLKSLVSGLGRSFEALGFPGGKRHFKATLTRKLRETGDEAIVAVRQTQDAAAAIADQLRSTGALEQEPEAMEDRSFAGVPKLFDVVSLSPDAGDTWGPLRNGATGEIGTIDNYGEALVYIPSRTEVQNVHWYSFRDIVLATKGGKEVAAMTLEEWQQMPSVRANYVSLEPPGPPPSPIRPGNQWAARGRLDTRNLQLDLEGEGGRSVAYADASLVIEEGQVPELQGTWRAEDGSHGTFEGLKVCRESRMGGVWRFEIQAGGDPIEHAWNAWLTAHPADSGSEGDARASHLLRITGAALAGPFLSEKETVECHPTIMGEFNSLTRSLHVEMSSEGEKWDGMILDAELGTDGALRGTWQKGEQSGRWIARHIGKKNTQSCFKPQVDEGGKWDPKACVVKTNLQMISTRPQPGDKVKLSKAYKQFDGEDGCLKPGQIGTLVEDDRTSCPFLVEGPNGMSHWYNDGALVVVNKEDKELLTPLGDMFEGVALLRFPVREGLWYAELDVSKLGKSQPCVGWALQKNGSPKIVRLMAIGGKSAVKLDLGEGAPPRKKKEKGRKDEDQENPEAKEGEDGEEGDDGDDGEAPGEGEGEEAAEEKDENAEGEGEGENGEEGEKEGGEDGEDEEEEFSEEGHWKYGESFGAAWKEGDVIGVLFSAKDGTCKLSFSLNGSFVAPMGEAFSMDVDEESTLALVLASGDEGEIEVNLGQRLFQTSPKLEGLDAFVVRGLGEAMKMRPAWKVQLPKGVKAWPVFEEPSRTSKGRKPLEDKTEVDQLHSATDNWVQLMEGWVQTRMLVAGTEYEGLKLRPPWSPVDPPRKKKEARKKRQQTVHATFDTEFCETRNWQFTGTDLAVAQGGPDLLVSAEAASNGILKWLLKIEEGNDAVEVGIVPVSEVEEPGYLFNTGQCGLKSESVSGGDGGGEQKPTWPMYMKFVEIICDVDRKKASFHVGSKKDNLQEVKTLELPYDEEIRLAVTGWSGTRVRLEPPQKWMGGDDSDSDSDSNAEEDDRFSNTCGNVVQPSTWHVASICVDLEKKQEMQIILDGEQHLVARDPNLFAPEGLFSIDPVEGLVLFGRRRAGKIAEREWRLGGHLRQMRMESKFLSISEAWGQQLPKGVWGCRTCGSRSAADVRICWSCHTARQKSASRPPNDADPRHDGLTVLVADSFKELVLESKEHVFVLLYAPWCEACQEVKPHWRKLAKMLKGSSNIRIAMMDSDENDAPSRFFPESFIPNVKLFLAGKKGKPLACNSRERTFESYVKFLEEHTNVSLESAAEEFYPQYCEVHSVPALVEELRQAAMIQELKLMQWRRPPLQALALFLYSYLLDPNVHSVAITPIADAIREDESQVTAPEPGPFGMRGAVAPEAAQRLLAATPSVEPPRLVRHLSQPPLSTTPALSRGVSGQRSPVPALLNRVISTPLEQVADPHKLEEELKRAHLAELLDKELQAELKKAQPDNVRDFVRDFCLRMAAPKFQHRLFFNARLGVSWRRAPAATYIVAATRIFRSLRRWLRRDLRRIGRTPRAPEPWAEARVAPMTAAALRSNWRRVEEAICKETSHEAGVASLQILLERGFDPNAAPFRVSPLLLASLAGNLHAAQFLYVRGGDMHQAGGVSQHQQLLPIDGASACGFLRLVAFFRENGSTGARALHFAASGGHLDVCKYLLATGVSPDLKADKGISAFTLALLYGECLAALVLLPHCSPANLEEALPGEVCWRLGLAGGSTVLHLAAHLGGSRERLLAPLLERCPVLLNRANWAQEIPAMLAPTMMRPTLQPRSLHAFEALGACPETASVEDRMKLAIAGVLGEDASATEEELKGEMCVICMEGPSDGDTPFTRLYCGHCFHRGCLGGWRAEGQNGASCPACRKPLPEPTARAEAGGMTLLEIAALGNSEDFASLLLSVGAGGKATKSSEITPLMWAHWKGSEAVAQILTAKGWQLANSDLEGLQNLRTLQRRASKQAESAQKAASKPESEKKRQTEEEKEKDKDEEDEEDEAIDPTMLQLLDVNVSALWHHLRAIKHSEAVLELRARMASSSKPLSVMSAERPRVDDPQPSAAECLKACRAALSSAGESSIAAESRLEAAKIFALRRFAEGESPSLLSAMVLRLVLGAQPNSARLLSKLSESFTALCSQAPLRPADEEVLPLLTQLQLAVEALPAERGVQFLGLGLSTPSGTLREALQGEVEGVAALHPGNLLLWRGCTSVTSDPMLAKEAALENNVSLVFKVRSSCSRDVAAYSPSPDLKERLLPPRRCFRVVGIFAMEDMILQRGTSSSGHAAELLEAFEVPNVGSLGSFGALAWEEACTRKAACVVLDEEDQPQATALATKI